VKQDGDKPKNYVPKRLNAGHRGLAVMVFNATFNNISVILWQAVLLVEETGYPGENQTCHKSPTTFSHNVVSSTHNDSGDSP